jgi:hypothetical protein
MLHELRAALLARLAEVAPALAASDFGEAVGFWTERVEFGGASPLDYRDWLPVVGLEGHVIGEVVAELADGVGAPLIASLYGRRLRVDPPDDATPGAEAYGLLAELIGREDGSVEGANLLVTQLRFRLSGGVYRHDPAPPVPAPPPEEDPRAGAGAGRQVPHG